MLYINKNLMYYLGTFHLYLEERLLIIFFSFTIPIWSWEFLVSVIVCTTEGLFLLLFPSYLVKFTSKSFGGYCLLGWEQGRIVITSSVSFKEKIQCLSLLFFIQVLVPLQWTSLLVIFYKMIYSKFWNVLA